MQRYTRRLLLASEFAAVALQPSADRGVETGDEIRDASNWRSRFRLTQRNEEYERSWLSIGAKPNVLNRLWTRRLPRGNVDSTLPRREARDIVLFYSEGHFLTVAPVTPKPP